MAASTTMARGRYYGPRYVDCTNCGRPTCDDRCSCGGGEY